MSGPSQRNLKQTITYWAPDGVDDYNQPKFDDPVLLRGMWTTAEQLSRRTDGDEIMTKYIVFLTQDVSEKGYLALGSFSGESDPKSTDFQAFEIHSFTSTPDLRFMEQERKALI